MSDQEPVGLFSGDATAMAAMYERVMVPGLFLPWARELVARVGVQPGQQVLDVGCGTGAVSRVLSQTVGSGGTVEGIDLAPGMLAHAQGLGLSNAQFQVGDATDLPYEDARFDAAVSQQAVQFVPDWPKAVAEMHRVVRPGGRLGIACWTAREDQPWLMPVFEMLEARGWDAVRAALSVPCSMQPVALAERVGKLGCLDVDIARVEKDVHLPDSFVDEFMTVPPYAGEFLALNDSERAALVAEMRERLQIWKDADGYSAPSVSTVLTATR